MYNAKTGGPPSFTLYTQKATTKLKAPLQKEKPKKAK
jgi:hypothetical protein